MCMVRTPIRLRSPQNETSRKKRFECYRQHYLLRLIHCRDFRSSRAFQFQALREPSAGCANTSDTIGRQRVRLSISIRN